MIYIGIFRCAAYSSSRGTPLYLPSDHDSSSKKEVSSVQHFHEKLLKIQGDELFTTMAKKEAEKRQKVVSSFTFLFDFDLIIIDDFILEIVG